MAEKQDTGIVQIHGKEYHTVARRIRDFWDKFPQYSLETKVQSTGDVVRVKATIRDNNGQIVSTGHAEEIRGSTQILKTSALETCETSACGRALSLFGMSGSEIASAEEIAQALEQQRELELVERLKAHNAIVRDNIETITAMKAYLLNGEYSAAYEAWAELTPDEKAALWIAPTKGGIFTTDERARMKSNEWNEAKNDYHGGEKDD